VASLLKSWVALLLLAGAFALAQDDLDDTFFGGDDDLFGDSIVSESEQDPDFDPSAELLESESVVIGGNFSVSAEIDLDLNAEDGEDPFSSGVADLNTRIFLDARPSSDFAVFIKGDASYKTRSGVDFELREMFADFDVSDRVFLRAGKQTVNWGVGRFFSPANLINLESIDPENPEDELVGPVALKAQLPFGANNLTGYLVMEDVESPIEVAIGTRYEFLVRDYEVTTGGVFQLDGPWAAMATTTGAIEGVTVFAEAVFEGNSDKVFVVETPSGLSTEKRPEAVYFSSTFGARASYSNEDDTFSVAGTVQYFFNGLAYGDPDLLAARAAELPPLFVPSRDIPLRATDLRERSRHNAAASLRFSDLAGSEFTPSLFWIGSLSDGSGFGTASLRYGGIDHFTPSATYRYVYGAQGAEYSPSGPSHSLKVGLSVSGTF
jgi:hypothetical protein